MFSSTSNEQTFTGNGVATTFAFAENTNANANVQVRYVGPSGTPVTLVEGTHYTLSGVGGTGGITVTYPDAASPAPYDATLLSTEELVVWLSPVLDQDFSQQWSSSYQPAVFEAKLDDITRTQQEHKATLDRTYRGYVGTTVAAGTLPASALGSGKVLLQETSGVGSGTEIIVQSDNWPATYESVELEIAGFFPASAAVMIIKPLDGGAAVTSDLQVTTDVIFTTSSAVTVRSSWALDTTRPGGITADDWVTGSAIFRYYNAGYIGGQGSFTYRNGSAQYGTTAVFSRNAVPVTSWDGFQVEADTGANVTGKIRLWGLPKL